MLAALRRLALVAAVAIASPVSAVQQWGVWTPGLGAFGHWTWGPPADAVEDLPDGGAGCRLVTDEGAIYCWDGDSWELQGGGGGAADFSELTGQLGDAQTADGAIDGGTGGEIADGSVTAADLAADSVGSSELDAAAVESELEAVLDLPQLQGLLTDAQLASQYALLAGRSGGQVLLGDTADLLGLRLQAGPDASAAYLFLAGDDGSDRGLYGRTGTDGGITFELRPSGGPPNPYFQLRWTGIWEVEANTWYHAWKTDRTARLDGEADGDLALTGGGSFVGALEGNADTATTATTANAGDSATSFFPSGTIETARLGSGTANSTTYLRGDSTWQTVASGDSPGGADGTLQYRVNSTTLGGVTGSTVSGANIALGGSLSGVTQLDVDNIRVDGNVISATTGAVNAAPRNGNYFCVTNEAGTAYTCLNSSGNFVSQNPQGRLQASRFRLDGDAAALEEGSGLLLKSSNVVAWGSSNWYDASVLSLTRVGAGLLGVRDGSTGGAAISLVEQTAPAAPATNGVYIYAQDNGAGKTQLMARFATGSAAQIAIEP